VLLQRNFGIEVKDMKEGQKIFYSIDTLANYVYENKDK
jgi:acyl carrier protein